MNLNCSKCNRLNPIPEKSIQLKAKIFCLSCKERIFINEDIQLISETKHKDDTQVFDKKKILDAETVFLNKNIPKLIVEGVGTFELKEGGNSVGRFSIEKPSDIMIDNGDEFLSRQHFLITKSENDWAVFDLGSKNKTFLNGKEIISYEYFLEGYQTEIYWTKQILKYGDIIEAGKTKILFKL